MVIRKDPLSHWSGQKWESTLLHKLPQALFCFCISSSCCNFHCLVTTNQKNQRCTLTCTFVFQRRFLSPLPMMMRGLLDAVKTETASAMALESAALKGGGGQQDTSLDHKDTFKSGNTRKPCRRKKKSPYLTFFLSTLAFTMSPAMST